MHVQGSLRRLPPESSIVILGLRNACVRACVPRCAYTRCTGICNFASLFSHFSRPREHCVVARLRVTLSVRYVSRTARHIRAYTHAGNTEEHRRRIEMMSITVCAQDCGRMLRARETADLLPAAGSPFRPLASRVAPPGESATCRDCED